MADDDLLDALREASVEDLADILDSLPDTVVAALLRSTLSASTIEVPPDPLAQALEIDEGYRVRAHLSYLSERLAQAVADVEAGKSRHLLVSMPPRSGKSHLTSTYFPLWMMRKHPDWKVGLISHTDTLAVNWGRAVRKSFEENGAAWGVGIARDAGAASYWETTARGSLTARSLGQSITGLGFKVMLIDDAVKDFASAHSQTLRDNVWDWWAVNAVTRLEPPSLVVVIGTRWHEDDLIGRLRSTEYPGDPDEWEVISFPALAEEGDILGRAPGDPLYSPLLEETREEALTRWEGVRRTVGSYAWSALYQQRPSPARGAIFDVSWWRYWTLDPNLVTDDGTVVLLDTERIRTGRWLDSWDTSFKGSNASDYVVGQRWVRVGADRFLVAQQRGRWSFTETLERIKRWVGGTDATGSPWGSLVHQRLIEETANGPAIIDTLRTEVSGIKPVKTPVGKEARARAVTPEIESGNVYLPLPSSAGWVTELLSELRNFPHDAHDDQVDALTQALAALRESGRGGVTVPGARAVARVPGRGASSGLGRRNYG